MFDYLTDQEEGYNWLELSRPEEFWSTAGKLSQEEVMDRFQEIPEYYKPLALTIIQIIHEMPELSCREFRHVLYATYKDLLENKGQTTLDRKVKDSIDLHLPYYWYGDGVMIPPEYIVKITNGIVGFVCDGSRKECLMTKEECRFRD